MHGPERRAEGVGGSSPQLQCPHKRGTGEAGQAAKGAGNGPTEGFDNVAATALRLRKEGVLPMNRRPALLLAGLVLVGLSLASIAAANADPASDYAASLQAFRRELGRLGIYL